MTNLTDLQMTCLERDAALFWLNEMTRCEWMAPNTKVALFEARLKELKDMFDPPQGISPEVWDFEVTARYPHIERIGRQLIEKLIQGPDQPWQSDIE